MTYQPFESDNGKLFYISIGINIDEITSSPLVKVLITDTKNIFLHYVANDIGTFSVILKENDIFIEDAETINEILLNLIKIQKTLSNTISSNGINFKLSLNDNNNSILIKHLKFQFKFPLIESPVSLKFEIMKDLYHNLSLFACLQSSLVSSFEGELENKNIIIQKISRKLIESNLPYAIRLTEGLNDNEILDHDIIKDVFVNNNMKTKLKTNVDDIVHKKFKKWLKLDRNNDNSLKEICQKKWDNEWNWVLSDSKKEKNKNSSSEINNEINESNNAMDNISNEINGINNEICESNFELKETNGNKNLKTGISSKVNKPLRNNANNKRLLKGILRKNRKIEK